MKKSELLANINAQFDTFYGWYDFYYENNRGCWKYRWNDSEVFDEIRSAKRDNESITVKRLRSIRAEIIENGTFHRSGR